MRYAAALMLGALADTGAESAAGHTWVPIRVSGGATTYFNPETNALKKELPAGGKAAPVVNFLDLQQPEPIGMDADAEDPDIPVAQSQTSSSSVASITAATAAQVEESDAKSCYPQCTWNCTKPVCNQDCKPECEQPTCQTRCPKPDYSQCSIDCQTPHCSVFCPKDLCKAKPGAKCSSPKCSTQCARPVCALKCKNRVPCNNVCHPPRCTWNCRNPRECHKPECRLVCERPLGCAQTYELPPLSPALTVEKSFTADRAKWVAYEWSQCGVTCGKSVKTRKVMCSTGEDHHCQFGVKPPTEQECEDMKDCNKWQKGTWGKCSAVCGRGKMIRKVWCENEDKNECFGQKPSTQRECMDEGDHCSLCKVDLFGGPFFTGWKATFHLGQYDTAGLIAKGAQCEEVSSMRVHGACCRTTVFQYGDFNKKHKGWDATFGEGKHDLDALEEGGVQDNDVSSMEVYYDHKCDAVLEKKKGLFGTASKFAKSARKFSARNQKGLETATADAIKDLEGSTGSSGGFRIPGLGGGGGADDEDTVDENDSPSDLARKSSNSVERASDQTRDMWEAAIAGGDGRAGGGKPYPWWFWLLIGLIVIGVVVAVVLACRRRQ